MFGSYIKIDAIQDKTDFKVFDLFRSRFAPLIYVWANSRFCNSINIPPRFTIFCPHIADGGHMSTRELSPEFYLIFKFYVYWSC